MSAPSVKQHLACIRMLFDWLVTGQVVPVNPAHSVRGPRQSVSKGVTPVLSPEEVTALLAGMDISTVVGMRNRAIIAVMTYTFAPIRIDSLQERAGFEPPRPSSQPSCSGQPHFYCKRFPAGGGLAKSSVSERVPPPYGLLETPASPSKGMPT